MSEVRRVVIVNAVSSTFGGGITVAQCLTEAMARRRPDERFVLFHSHADVGAFCYPENVECVHTAELVDRPRRWWWEQARLPAEADRRGAAVILQLGGFASFRARVPQVSVWQNATIFAEAAVKRPLREEVYIRVQRRIQAASMRRVDDNVFLTDDSVKVASQCWPLDDIPHRFIHSGVDVERLTVSRPAPPEERDALCLSIGHSYFHKNYENMIDAVGRYRERYGDPLPLEIVGAPYDTAHHQALLQRIRDADLTDLVRMTGLASREEVGVKLARARIYVVTSVLETFGLTVLEAMGAGVPVVASRATCLPEVCGDAAVYCDPYDPDDIADQLHRVISDVALQQELQRRGLDRVKHFSWERSASAYLQALDAVAC